MGLGDDINGWCYRSPWLWALYPIPWCIWIGYQLGSWLVGAICGIVMFLVTGWSWSRGWGRRRYERRHPPASN
jgi:hypothetical protein